MGLADRPNVRLHREARLRHPGDCIEVILADAAVPQARGQPEPLDEARDRARCIVRIAERVADQLHLAGSDVRVEAHRVGEDHCVREAMRDAGAPSDELGEAVVESPRAGQTP